MKQGQVSMFVIVGLLILIGVGLLLYLLFTNSSSTPLIKDHPQVSPLIEECVQRSLLEAKPVLAMQGGYILVPEPNVAIEGVTVPVVNSQIELSTIEEQLELLLNSGLYGCVIENAFPGFEQDRFTNLRSNVTFVGEYVLVNANFTYNDEEYRLQVEEYMNLVQAISIANEVIESNLAYDNDYGRLAGVKMKYDATIETIPFGGTTIYYIEQDEQYFAFAMSD